MESMAEGLIECLETLKSQGYILPLTFSAIAANGVAYIGRYSGEWDNCECEFLYSPDDPLQIPIRFMFVDARGEAAGFVVAASENYFVKWPPVPSSAATGH